jgi:hypothetical protein
MDALTSFKTGLLPPNWSTFNKQPKDQKIKRSHSFWEHEKIELNAINFEDHGAKFGIKEANRKIFG